MSGPSVEEKTALVKETPGKARCTTKQLRERLGAREVERFLSKTSPCPITGCWWWSGCLDKDGYGRFLIRFNRKKEQWRAHRVSLFLAGIDLGTDLVVMHSCDQPSCVNPQHLSVGTQSQNIQDCVRKARDARGEKVGGSRLTTADVKAIRASTLSAHKLAKLYGVCVDAAWKAKTGRAWKHLPMVNGESE